MLLTHELDSHGLAVSAYYLTSHIDLAATCFKLESVWQAFSILNENASAAVGQVNDHAVGKYSSIVVSNRCD